eukprot:scaffold1793_cov399-Prasinococcus_capsulatus_cf.AAC.6
MAVAAAAAAAASSLLARVRACVGLGTQRRRRRRCWGGRSCRGGRWRRCGPSSTAAARGASGPRPSASRCTSSTPPSRARARCVRRARCCGPSWDGTPSRQFARALAPCFRPGFAGWLLAPARCAACADAGEPHACVAGCSSSAAAAAAAAAGGGGERGEGARGRRRSGRAARARAAGGATGECAPPRADATPPAVCGANTWPGRSALHKRPRLTLRAPHARRRRR